MVTAIQSLMFRGLSVAQTTCFGLPSYGSGLVMSTCGIVFVVLVAAIVSGMDSGLIAAVDVALSVILVAIVFAVRCIGLTVVLMRPGFGTVAYGAKRSAGRSLCGQSGRASQRDEHDACCHNGYNFLDHLCVTSFLICGLCFC